MPPTMNRPVIDRDAELLEALRRREATAAERLVSTFGNRAYRLAIGITGNRQDAEEAVQDAFWNVIQKIDTFRGDAALGSWIYRIAANAAYQRRSRRARRRHEISLDEVLPPFHEDGRHADSIGDWTKDLAEPAVQIELRTSLTSALDELPGPLPSRDHPARRRRLPDGRCRELSEHHGAHGKGSCAPSPPLSSPASGRRHVRGNLWRPERFLSGHYGAIRRLKISNGGWRSSPKALPSAEGPSTLSGSTVLAWIAWGNHGARRVGHLIASLGRAARASRLAG